MDCRAVFHSPLMRELAGFAGLNSVSDVPPLITLSFLKGSSVGATPGSVPAVRAVVHDRRRLHYDRGASGRCCRKQGRAAIGRWLLGDYRVFGETSIVACGWEHHDRLAKHALPPAPPIDRGRR